MKTWWAWGIVPLWIGAGGSIAAASPAVVQGVASEPPMAVLSSLGPLSGRIPLGSAMGWTTSVDNDRLVLQNLADKDAIRFDEVPWSGDRATGRVASAEVTVAGPGMGDAAPVGGLVFHVSPDKANWLAWAETGEGLMGLYRRDASGVKMIQAYDVPGGRRAAGDVLSVSDKGGETQLLVNGSVVASVPPGDAGLKEDAGQVGIVAMGEGRMTFRAFALSPSRREGAFVPIGPIADGTPIGPLADGTPTGPVADSTPAGSNAPPVAGSASDAPLSSLGPLVGEVALGRSGAWSAASDGGRLVLGNADSAGAVRFYSTQWQGDLAGGRSIGVKVKATGNGALSAGGLIFRISDGDPRWIAWVITSDGKVAAYSRKADGLKLVNAAPIPGGRRPDGDLLQINQKGDVTQLLVNGQLMTDVPPQAGKSANDPLPVGVVALGTGEFTFGDFAFGPLVKPLVGDDTVPVPGPQAGGDDTVPVPQAGGDDTVPVPKPPVTPPSPSEQTSGTADIPGMGPLGKAVTLGRDATWTKSVQNGQLVFANDTDGDATYTRTIGWGDIPPAGRSAGVRVTQQGASGASRGGGLTFGYGDKGARYLAFIVTAEGKAALFNIKDGSIDPVASIDLPGGQTGTHLMQISRTGTRTKLFADGRLVTTLSPDDGRGLDLSGDVGVVAVGTGRFAFDGFAFGPPVGAAAAPNTAPPAQTSGTADIPGMGPLGKAVTLGRDATWTKSVQNGQLVFANDTDGDATYTRTIGWGDIPPAGRSAGVRVTQQGASGASRGGGLTFGYGDKGARYLAFIVTAEGKATLFNIKDGSIDPVASIDLPGGQTGTHLMQISRTGTRTKLFADGRLVTTLSPDDGRGLDLSGDVGVVAVGTGRFAFDGFAFGPPVGAAAAPNTAPLSQTSGTLDIQSLGAIGKGIKLGLDGKWTWSLENGRLVLANDVDPNALQFRTLPWPSATGRGRSVSVRAEPEAGAAAAGIAFGYDDKDDRSLIWAATGDGKVTLYRFVKGKLDPMSSFDVPGGRRAGGSLLQVSQLNDKTTLLVDGRAITTLPAKDRTLNPIGKVGIVTYGEGRYAFADFSFGPAVTAEATPPAAGTKQAGLETLGPLAELVELGHSGSWDLSPVDGSLLLTNPSDPKDIIYWHIPWQGTPARGRSVTVKAQPQGTGPESAAGLMFRFTNGEPAVWLAWVAGADGKATVYKRSATNLEVLADFAIPGGNRADGDTLQVVETADRIDLSVNGTVLKTYAARDKTLLPNLGETGVVVMPQGRFTVSDFAFGTGRARSDSN